MSSASNSKITQDNVAEKYAGIFAPWVKAKGLSEFRVTEGFASAVLRQDPSLQWAAGAICGQAIMSAIDTVASLCASTSPHGQPRGTVSQNNQFIRPAFAEDLLIEVSALNFGKTLGYFEANVLFVKSRKLVAHATLEFMY